MASRRREVASESPGVTRARVVVIVVLLALAITLPVAAAASSVGDESLSWPRFYSPSGNIECQVLTVVAGTPSIDCLAWNNGRVAEVSANGRTNDFHKDSFSWVKWQHGNVPVLGYGKVWARGRFLCQSKTAGMSCHVVGETARGFTINRDGIRWFGQAPTPAPAPAPARSTWPPAGFALWNANIAIKFGRGACKSYEDSCYHVILIARYGCANDLLVTLNEYRGNTIVGDTNGSLSTLPPGQQVDLDIPSLASSAQSARIASVDCL